MATRYLILFFCLPLMVYSDTTASLLDRSRTLLQQALEDRNPNTRKEAVVALGLMAAREPFLSKLESMLSDRDVQVRIATVASLEDLRSKRAIAALHGALHDPVPEVSFAAAKALFELNDPEGQQALLSVLGGRTKTASFFISKEMRDAMRMMHTPKQTFFFALRQGIGFAPVPGLGVGVASLQQLLSDPGVSGRATAALLLGKNKNEQTREALLGALDDKDWSVRAAAIHSLVLWDDTTLRPDIGAMINDDKQEVRLRAAAGYLRLTAIALEAKQNGKARVRHKAAG